MGASGLPGGTSPLPPLCSGKPTTPTSRARRLPRTCWCTTLTRSCAVPSSSTTTAPGSPWWNCKLPVRLAASLPAPRSAWPFRCPHGPWIKLSLPLSPLHPSLHPPHPRRPLQTPPPPAGPSSPTGPLPSCALSLPRSCLSPLALSSDSPYVPTVLPPAAMTTFQGLGAWTSDVTVSQSWGPKSKSKASAGRVPRGSCAPRPPSRVSSGGRSQ